MANIAHFMIPADNIERAKHFYQTLPGLRFEPAKNLMDPSKIAEMQYYDISTGAAKEWIMNTGGLYKRHRTEPILTFVEAGVIDMVLLKVENLGGKITMPEEEIREVGLAAVIRDSEGNVIGLCKPEIL